MVLTALVASLISVGWAQSLASPVDVGRSVAPLVERVKDAVVTIQSTKVIRRAVREDPFGRYLRERYGINRGAPGLQQTQQSLGSGFIIRKDGLVLTNNHVVAGADELKVLLSDYRAFDAKVLGRDPATDVAVVLMKDPGPNLRVAVLGDSEKVRVGDYVLAIGNPLGLGQTVTMGIVSAKNRGLGGKIINYEDFIQTDAAINQGNSGGPLFSFQGEVIGVNSAILNPAMAMNVGFAIPINLAQSIADQLSRTGKVARGMLGVRTMDLTPEEARRLGVAFQPGAVVNIVEPRSPAEKAGLRPNDIIIEVSGRRVDANTLGKAVQARRPGEIVKIGVLRRGKRQDFDVTLGENALLQGGWLLGVLVAPLSADEKRALGLEGLKVIGVDPSGPASGSIRENDVIVGVMIMGRQPVPATIPTLRSLEGQLNKGGWGRLVILREGYEIVVTIS